MAVNSLPGYTKFDFDNGRLTEKRNLSMPSSTEFLSVRKVVSINKIRQKIHETSCPSTALITIVFVAGLFMLDPGVEGTLTTVPINTFATEDGTVRLNCTTNSSQYVYWRRILNGSSTEDWIYNGTVGFIKANVDVDRYTISRDYSTGRHDVEIEPVERKDAGRYTCVDESGDWAAVYLDVVATKESKSNVPVAAGAAVGGLALVGLVTAASAGAYIKKNGKNKKSKADKKAEIPLSENADPA